MSNTTLFLLALIPVAWLMISLGVLKVPAYKATIIGFIITYFIAIVGFKMPVHSASLAALEGIAMGLWPIMIVIFAAIFTYNLATFTKSIDTIKNMLSSISSDQRIQVLILAWGFGAFLESVAGYGTAVAIPASILISLGFQPLFAAIICLIANTVPTAFGAVGIPVITLADVTQLNVTTLSYNIGLQLTIFILLIPFILVIFTTRSIKGIKGVFGITLVSGVAFAIPHLIATRYLGAELPALIGSLSSLIATIAYAKVFHKEDIKEDQILVTPKQAFVAWLPYILIFTFVILTSPLIPFINEPLSHIKTAVMIYSDEVHQSPFIFKWITTPGTLILIAAFIGGFVQGATFKDMIRILGYTFKSLIKSGVTVLSIVALSKVMGYSGMTAAIAMVLVDATGRYYPLFSPMIGALGTFLTGSDTSANALFGPLQTQVADSIQVNPYWLTAANTSGATAGKMISPQSIAIAASAAGLIGSESKIFSTTIKFCLVAVVLLGLLIFAGSFIV